MTAPLLDVSDTAFWIAHHRAVESARPDALFLDRFAERLAGERGRRISQAMPTARIVGWMVALRTRMIDSFIETALEAGVDTVLCLGAGLDARPYRLALPSQIHWVEADYAHVIEYKESILESETPRCRLERVKIDLSDESARRRLLERVDGASATGVVVLTEGVIPYLDNGEVAALAAALRSMRRTRFWIVDYLSPQAMRLRRRRRIRRAMQNAPFKFAPNDWFDFFRNQGWRVGRMRYYLEAATQFARPPPLPIAVTVLLALSRGLMGAERQASLRRFGGYAMLEPLV